VDSYSNPALTRLQLFEQRVEWPLAAVAIAFLASYSVQVLTRPSGRESVILSTLEWGIWGLFVVDYIARLCLASQRWRWFWRHLFDLAIVALPLLRPLRFLRLVVLIGALQNAVGHAVRGRIAIYTASFVVLLVYVSSLAIFDKEHDQPGANIKSFGQAVWYSVATITTVGYGDLYPVTVMGRLIAVGLMVGGISVLGVVTASVASWIIQRVAEVETTGQAATAAQIDDLRGRIDWLAEQLTGGATPG
jgi:voltage-gated potassium channel